METFYNFRRSIFDPLAWFLSRTELRKMIDRADGDAEAILRVTEAYIGRGYYARINAYQRRTEILQLGRLIQHLQPKTILEIGTNKGGTFFFWCRLIRELECIASIDLAGGDFGGGYDIRRIKLYREFLYDRPNTQLLFLRSNSHDLTTKTQLTHWLNSRSIDFLYIDGDHTYDGARLDFEMYAYLVRPGGLIAFHDIVTKGQGHEVYKFWNEYKTRYQYIEIIENPSSSMGIGVIRVPDE